jgi:hypothetical protein
VGVTRRIQRVLVHEDEAERALEQGQHLERRRLDRAVWVGGQKCGDERRVGRVPAPELAALAGGRPELLGHEIAQLHGVDEISVVGQRN